MVERAPQIIDAFTTSSEVIGSWIRLEATNLWQLERLEAELLKPHSLVVAGHLADHHEEPAAVTLLEGG